MQSFRNLLLPIAILFTTPAVAADIDVWARGASDPQTQTIQPLAGPMQLAFRDLPAMNFAFVLVLPGGTELFAFEGSGKLTTSGAQPFWQWQVDRALFGNRSSDPVPAPLAQVLMLTDGLGAVTRAEATFPAFHETNKPQFGSPLHHFTTWLVASLLHGFISLPEGGIQPNGPAGDPNIYVEGFLTAFKPEAIVVQRLPMTTAIGTVSYGNSEAIVAHTAGDFVVEDFAERAVLSIDGYSLIDVDTGLPRYTDHTIKMQFTTADGQQGEVEYALRSYIDY